MVKNDYRRVILFLSRKVHTGGEKYLAEIYSYLQHKGLQVEAVYSESSSRGKHGLHLAVDCLLANFKYFFRVLHFGNLSDVVIFEDFYFHPRLWLFNIFVRLFSGRLRTVVLVQAALFYHAVLRHVFLRRIDSWIVRIFLNQASLILTNSEYNRQKVLSLGISQENVQTVYCGYDKFFADEVYKKSVNERNSKINHILFVGQCVENKGIEYLVHAVKELSNYRVVLDIVGSTKGDIEYFTKLQNIIKKLNLQDRVNFYGQVNDNSTLAKYYKRASVFVLPSIVEGFGIVLLEAMSFGLSIVATNVGAIPELIKHGENGILVPPKDSKALALAIDKFLSSPSLLKQYGKNSFRFFQEHKEFYSWEHVSNRLGQFLEPIISVGGKWI